MSWVSRLEAWWPQNPPATTSSARSTTGGFTEIIDPFEWLAGFRTEAEPRHHAHAPHPSIQSDLSVKTAGGNGGEEPTRMTCMTCDTPPRLCKRMYNCFSFFFSNTVCLCMLNRYVYRAILTYHLFHECAGAAMQTRSLHAEQ